MIPSLRKTTARTLSVLFLLWNLNGCAHTATQSRPAPDAKPGESASVPPTVREAPFPACPETQAESQGSGPAPAKAQEEVPALPMKPEPPFFVHVVRWEGETLSGIAEWYTGSWRNWKAIARANSRIDPDRMRLGNRIQIPESLLKTHQPMPREFMPVRDRQEKTSRSSPARVRREAPETGPVTKAPRTDQEHKALSGRIEGAQADKGFENPRATPEPVHLFGPGEIAGNPETIPEKTELFGPVE